MVALSYALPAWAEHAACVRWPNRDLWLSDNRQDQHDAALICQTCPVIHQCAEYAIAGCVDGVWGGLTTRERKAIRRARKDNHHGR